MIFLPLKRYSCLLERDIENFLVFFLYKMKKEEIISSLFTSFIFIHLINYLTFKCEIMHIWMNIIVFSNQCIYICALKSNTQCNDICKWDLWKVIKLWNMSPHQWDHCPYNRCPKVFLWLLHSWVHTENNTIFESEDAPKMESWY